MQDTVAQIPARWVAPIRIVTAMVVVFHLFLFVTGIEARYTEITTICNPEECQPLILSQADVDVLTEMGLNLDFYARYLIGVEIVLVTAVALLVAFLFWRASTHWIGIVAILSMLYTGMFVADVVYALGRSGAEWYLPVTLAASISGIGVLLVFYIFPDGRFYPSWSMIPPLILIPLMVIGRIMAVQTGEFVGGSVESSNPGNQIAGFALFASFAFEFITQIIRYQRYYTPLQHQQTRWLIAGIVGQVVGVGLWTLVFGGDLFEPGRTKILVTLIGIPFDYVVLFGLLPLTFVVAILRYRLWNIDLIIRRTLQYAAITILLALTYFGGVIVLQTIFNRLTGSDSALAIVASTLLIAALFNPLRNRVQAFVDRRFYRQKYDTQQTLERFGDIARDEVVLEAIEQALVSTVHDTMQPEHVSLWLHDSR